MDSINLGNSFLSSVGHFFLNTIVIILICILVVIILVVCCCACICRIGTSASMNSAREPLIIPNTNVRQTTIPYSPQYSQTPSIGYQNPSYNQFHQVYVEPSAPLLPDNQ